MRPLSVVLLTGLTLLIHGYHPFAEDGGIYAAGVEHALNPSLFSHDAAFVDAHHAYSLFDQALALMVRASHLPLAWVLLLANLLCIFLALYAAGRIGQQCFPSPLSFIFAASLFAAAFTLPVAGTSLYVMEPYLTARSFSTPLCLLGISLLLPALFVEEKVSLAQPRSQTSPLIAAAGCFWVAAVFHPLMTMDAAVFVALLFAARSPSARTRWIGLSALAPGSCVVAAYIQKAGSPETSAMLAAINSRAYWFLSSWQSYEWLGIIGPLGLFALLLRKTNSPLTPRGAAVCRAALACGIIAVIVALLFAQQRGSLHAVARLQPLRAFLILYALMIIMLGAAFGHIAEARPRTARARGMMSTTAIGSALMLPVVAGAMFYAERLTFPASSHLELPGRASTNPWVEAFVWCRDHTPQSALFAMDANYITMDGEDAQNFRAIAQRSMLADFSKDGGVASIRPQLAAAWQRELATQRNLSSLKDGERDERLLPAGVTWMLLRASAVTTHPCPFNNGTVKVCRLTAAAS